MEARVRQYQPYAGRLSLIKRWQASGNSASLAARAKDKWRSLKEAVANAGRTSWASSTLEDSTPTISASGISRSIRSASPRLFLSPLPLTVSMPSSDKKKRE